MSDSCCNTKPNTLKNPYLKGYIALAVTLDTIVVFTVLRRVYSGNWNIDEMMADFMGAFLVVFGAFKLLDWPAFVKAFEQYDFLAKQTRLYAYLYPLIQIALGTAFLWRWQASAVSAITMGLMAFSAVGVWRALQSGQKIQCACLGTRIQLPMSIVSLIEDVAMILMASGMLFFHAFQ